MITHFHGEVPYWMTKPTAGNNSVPRETSAPNTTLSPSMKACASWGGSWRLLRKVPCIDPMSFKVTVYSRLAEGPAGKRIYLRCSLCSAKSPHDYETWQGYQTKRCLLLPTTPCSSSLKHDRPVWFYSPDWGWGIGDVGRCLHLRL